MPPVDAYLKIKQQWISNNIKDGRKKTAWISYERLS